VSVFLNKKEKQISMNIKAQMFYFIYYRNNRHKYYRFDVSNHSYYPFFSEMSSG